MDLTEEDIAMQAEVVQSLAHKKNDIKQSVERWKSEKEANEEYIAQMRANKEARKKEMEEMEKMKAQLLEEEDEEEPINPDLIGDIKPPVAQNNDVASVVVDKNEPFKSKEQAEMEEALAQRVRPLNMEGLDTDQLKDRAKEYWKAYTSIKMEKRQLAERLAEQDAEIRDVQERLAEFILAKQARKGVDMERLALGPGGKASKHPPKKQMFSKFDNRKGNRTYEERKGMYDEGVDSVRPKMLESVWEAKFSAWMDDDQACSFLDGDKVEDIV